MTSVSLHMTLVFDAMSISMLLQEMNATSPSQLAHLCRWGAPWSREVRGLLKEAPLGTRKVERLPPLLALSPGSYFWGLSSGSFKWGLVTAGTSWTKLLLPAPLLRCSHSPLIEFDCICLNPQWKKEKGGWKGLQWNWSVSVCPDTVAL